MAELNKVELKDSTGAVYQTDKTEAVGSDFVATTILDNDDPLLVDYVRKVTYGNDGIAVEGTTFTNQAFHEQIVEFDDTGRPVAQAVYDIQLGAKAKDYGDGSYWRQASFSRDITGHTTLGGLIAVAVSTTPFVKGDVIATLPAEIAPNVAETFVCVTDSGFARIDVLPTGEIKYNSSASTTLYVSLSGIRFFSPQG